MGLGLSLYEAVNRGDTSPQGGPLLPGCPVRWHQTNQAEGWWSSPSPQLGPQRARCQQAGRVKDAVVSTRIQFPAQGKS